MSEVDDFLMNCVMREKASSEERCVICNTRWVARFSMLSGGRCQVSAAAVVIVVV